MVVYFSGTGNSRRCAQILAHRLDDGLLDAFDYMRNGIAAELISDKPWVFVSPTYAWRLPHVFENFIRSGSFQGAEDAYFIMTCGQSIGAAGIYNRTLAEERGLRCRGTLGLVMPENYIAMFPVPGPDKAREIIARADSEIVPVAEAIAAGGDLPSGRGGLLGRVLSSVVNGGFYSHAIKSGSFRSLDSCTGCGQCARGCVTGNIEIKDGRPIWGDKCTHCMACICSCPNEAIEYGRASRGKPRYQCPEYKAPDA